MTSSEPRRPRVFVAGGSPVLVSALNALLEDPPNLVVGSRPYVVQSHIGVASDAVEFARSTAPDVVLLTLSRIVTTDTALAVQEIANACHGSRLLILLENPDWIACLPLLRAGVSGMLGPDFRKEALFRAVNLTAEGRLYLDPRIRPRGATLERDAVSGAMGGKSLTIRETEVLRLVARGYGNKAVAEVLNLSVKTVETYRARGMEKLGIKNKIELTQYAATKGWMYSDSSGPGL